MSYTYKFFVEKAKVFYNDAGIHLLIDSAATVCGITIIGRDDATNEERKKAEDLAAQTDPRSFRIMLNHQPDTLSQACRAGVDMQLSGHTHGGQIWPATWWVDITSELGHGYKEMDGTRFYVSSGMGIWGGRFRIGSRSEYVVIYLNPVEPPAFTGAGEAATPALPGTDGRLRDGAQSTTPL